VDFIIQPIEQNPTPSDATNYVCPGNGYQCGCNTVSGCGCPQG